MRTVVRNSFARHTITAERIRTLIGRYANHTCTECGHVRGTDSAPWLYRFHVDNDQGSRGTGPLAGGKLFCSRQCLETYIGGPVDETQRR